MYTFTRWVSTPENAAAASAVVQLLECVGGQRVERTINPLFLHGPPGSGKTHLVSALVAEVTQRYMDRVIEVRAANEVAVQFRPNNLESPDDFNADGRTALARCDLLLIEDLQHLPGSFAGPLANII